LEILFQEFTKLKIKFFSQNSSYSSFCLNKPSFSELKDDYRKNKKWVLKRNFNELKDAYKNKSLNETKKDSTAMPAALMLHPTTNLLVLN